MNKSVNLSGYKQTLDISAGKLKQILWYYTNLFFFLSRIFPFSGLKVTLLRIFGAKVGKEVVLKPAINIKYPWKLIIGDNVWIGENVWLDNLDNLIIGNNVVISQGVLILSGNHNYKSTAFDLITEKIELKNGVWIGAKAMVTAGVVCETHSVLSVKSVANKDLKAYGIYSGNPAKWIRQRVIQ